MTNLKIFLIVLFLFLSVETLRKYPPAAILQRIANNDYLVPGTKHVIEKGMPVIIPG